jgi:hypothetical protein
MDVRNPTDRSPTERLEQARKDQKARSITMPALQVRNTNGGDWRVHASFPDGSAEEISGFRTENEANTWIAEKLQDWLDRRVPAGT